MGINSSDEFDFYEDEEDEPSDEADVFHDEFLEEQLQKQKEQHEKENNQPAITHQNEKVPIDVENNINRLIGIRNEVAINQSEQAERMKSRSVAYLPEVNIGDFVALSVPPVDRGLSDPPNIICRVVDIDFTHDLYELVSEGGVINIMLARNTFEKLKSNHFDLHFVLDKSLSIRQAVNQISIGGGQGVLRCDCKGNCSRKICKCFKHELKCNSRCHASNSKCANK
jgi:hypothetical protein